MNGGDVFHDEIKGLNKGHALHLAKQNWSSAQKIEPTTKIAMHHLEREARSKDAERVRNEKHMEHEKKRKEMSAAVEYEKSL